MESGFIGSKAAQQRIVTLNADEEQGAVERGRASNSEAAPEAVTRVGKAAVKRRSPLEIVAEVVIIVAAAFAIAMLVQAFVVKPFAIHQVSMQPTLLEGDRILISRLTYHFREPRAGDVVVFRSPVNQRDDLVKRIVAVGGDRVAIKNGVLYVNGEPRQEPYLMEWPFAGEMAEEVVPDGMVFVMGDNRNNSGDSRFFGPVDEDSLVGCALCVYWPIGRWKSL